MLLITIELISARDGHRETLGKGTIALDPKELNERRTRGGYEYVFYTRGSSNRVWKTGKIYDFPRKALLGYDLVFRCLEDAIGERNQPRRPRVSRMRSL